MQGIHQKLSKVLAKKNRPIVFICGLGGSGKTTLAEKIAQDIEIDSVAVQSDWWAKYSTKERKLRIQEAIASGDADRIEQEENPQNWYDVWEDISSDLRELQETGTLVLSNAWNQKTGEKDLNVELSLPQKCLIIFDGIYLLHPEIADVADYIIFLDVSAEECRRRAESRDAHRSNPEYLAYKASLMEKYDIPYFEKYKSRADEICTE